tara:strand:- start:1098 stop:1754 length:657 start_codon:yes stop_codon:yes gene_type:complete
MSTPKKYFSKQGRSSDDGAGTYAEAQGHLLEFIDARNTQNYVSFVAFLTSFSQNFSSNWNQEEVMGRMDPISTFKNTKRTISVAWDIPAGLPAVAKENLARCNNLVSMLYPSYSKQGSKTNALAMSKPPLMRLKYANLVDGGKGKGLLGYVTSCDWQPNLEMGVFGDGKDIWPKVISISVSFQVLHEETPGFGPTDKKLTGKDWPFRSATIEQILGEE